MRITHHRDARRLTVVTLFQRADPWALVLPDAKRLSPSQVAVAFYSVIPRGVRSALTSPPFAAVVRRLDNVPPDRQPT